MAMDDTHTVILLLGRRHLAALGRVNLTAELSADQVAGANARQVDGAIEYVYLRPGSRLEQFVRSRMSLFSGEKSDLRHNHGPDERVDKCREHSAGSRSRVNMPNGLDVLPMAPLNCC
jgi:hypothetical protein